MEIPRGSQPGPQKHHLSRQYTAGTLASDSVTEVVPPSLSIITPILHVANEIERENRRVAWMCRFYALQKVHRLDPRSSGRGVRQFKTLLLKRLQLEDKEMMALRKQSSDTREMEVFFLSYYENYVKAYDGVDQTDRAHLAKACQTASVLGEALCAVNKNVPPEVMELIRDVNEKKAKYMPYNILPLDEAGVYHAIMKFAEIKAAVATLHDTDELPVWSSVEESSISESDILDFLQALFGFQKDNVANQREHLLLLLANAYIHLKQRTDLKQKTDNISELSERAIDLIMDQLLENYKKWCKFLGCPDNLSFPQYGQKTQQWKVICMGLYLLIWGEAANLRFMPECLCYIYYHMLRDLSKALSLSSGNTSENFLAANGVGEGSFLRNIVMPIYKVIEQETQRSKSGTAPHSSWRNYDDLNEHFWSADCLDWGLPIRGDGEFHKLTTEKNNSSQNPATRFHWDARKNNFVEIRTFWHLFRSFDRMWTFYILALQAMLVLAWNTKDLFTDMFQISVFEKVLSIFITSSILHLLQVILDLLMNLKSYKSKKIRNILRHSLKLLVAVGWVIVLPVCYVQSWENPTGLAKIMRNWFRQSGNDPSLYITAVVIYLLPNCLAMILFFLPFLGRWMENSEFQMIRIFCWWLQPRLYVGREMYAGAFTLFKYTIFWVVLLSSKLLFSYYIQIKPLVQSTQKILQITDVQYRWHEMFPSGHKTLGAIISIWAPVILVYFMDTQIWYSIFSTIVGGIIGAFRRLGEIRTLGMLRSRFQSLPVAFTDHLFPPEQKKSKQDDANTKNSYAKFAQLWNEMIKSFREEDLINNRELDLMIVPEICDLSANLIRWPSFLLASKIPIALGMAAAFKGKDQDLWKRISGVAYMKDAVLECYASFQRVLSELVIGDIEKGVIDKISKLMDTYIGDKTLFENVRMSALPELNKKFIELLEILEKNEESSRDSVIFVLQDMLEVVTGDFLMDWKWDLTSQTGNTRQEPSHGVGDPSHTPQWTKQLFANIEPPSLKYPLPESHAWNEEIKRLHLLLTVQETAMDVPSNLEARRRIAFFTNSLFMDIPNPPCVRNMISFSVLTPYFNEETSFSNTDIYKENEDGVSVLFYLQKIFPDEWDNFLERLRCKKEGEVWKHEDLWSDENNVLELRHWVSQRGQTLSRTVRGMMYNRRALKLQAFLDMASEEGFVLQSHALEDEISKRLASETLDAVVDMKFSYVVTCQNYGLEKQQGDRRAIDIFNLMVKYPSLRVAYIDTVEVREKDKVKREYYSVLVKAMNGLEQVIYRIKLPGPVMLGEGKPENQNHAIIFTRGEALQTIDMDQDNYLEEAFKMRNLLQEFKKEHGAIKPTILGLREHIFTGSVSSLAWFMFNQETSVVTIEQRVLANPLRVRFHYGHPDVFDRLFHITRGGIGKASRVINLSDDIFAGMNSILRGGNVTHHEYIQVGKGRDVGLNQISMFEAKVASGYGEQALSRDIYRLGHRLDFFRMLSCYFTTVGYYFNTMIVVLTAYVFLYGRIYLALSGLGESLNNQAELENNIPLEAALASQSLVQVGLLMSLPMVMEIGLERGFHSALSDFIVMQLQLASVFFTFSLGTKTHYFGRTILHGGAKYRPTVRGFVVRHDRFAEIYRLYSRSHFTKGLELMILLLVYNLFGPPAAQGGQIPYILVGFSMWFLVATWLFAPFLFNPSGFEWQKIVDDWEDWIKWMNNRGGIGVVPNKSWESWWDEEQEHLKHTGLLGRSIQSLLAFRFFLYQYGLVYNLSISNGSTSISVYGFSWLIILGLLTLLKVASMGRQRFSADFQLLFRLLKAFIFVGCISSLIVLFIFSSLTLGDVFTSILAFMPTAWALLQIAQACRPVMTRIGIWESTKALARGYEYIMGLIVFTPVAILAWFPFVSEFQTRLLFNQAFSRGLQISRILAGGKKGQN